MESEDDRDDEIFEGSEDSENPKVEYDEDFKFEKKEKKYQEMSFIMGCLKNHFIFYNLSEAELENVAKKMFYCSVAMDQFIFREGSKALCFFIIEKGMMQVITNEKVKKQLRVGDGFGELALLYKAPRAASVKACQTCNLWGIDRDTFRKAVEQIITQEYEQNRKFMENVRFFTCLSNEHKDSIAAALITQRFSKDQIIVTEGDPGSSFYIIKEGVASLWKGNKQIKRLQKADSFGEQALFYNTIRQMTVKAEDDVVCLVLGRQTLSKILGDQIFTVTFRNFMKWAFQKHFTFSKLTKNQIQQILNLMKINSYKSGSVVMKKNTENGANQKVIIVIQGALKKSKNMHPIATKSQIYGEEFLMENKPKTFDDQIVMESDGVLAEIGVDQFKGVIGDYLDRVISQNEKIIQDKLNAHRQLKKNKQYPNLSEFVLIKQMREGVFGPVLLVQHIHDKELFIIKCYNKQKIEEHFVQRYFLQEKSLLKQMNFPFVMELYKTYKDAKYLYSLVEFVRGEELYDVIREIGLLSTDDCQFYIGCMILILEHFYSQGIIYRDLKPENFIVDMKGYLKLIDLGTAKMIKMKNPLQAKTYTVIGTPYYMAPQVITNKGYNFTVDLYSLGVCMFEFLCGYVPFGEKSEDPMEIYEEILNAEVKYPKFLKDKKAKKLMDQFLSKSEPENRLGGANFNSLKTHPWFQSLDWEELKEKRVDPPKFDRFPNCEETQSELINYGKHARNLEDFLNEKFPNRFNGEHKPIYDGW